MFDELFPEASDTALTARLNRPPTPQAPRFSTWGLFAAAPKGVAAGASEAMSSTADMLGAYGSVMGTTGVSAGGMFSLPTPEERKQQIEATDKLLSDGPDYMSEGGRSFRNVAKDYTPDPITTHMAEGAVFNLFRMGSKAITAAATMGNIPGAVVAGAEEGFTMADQLAQQGVDIGTRTQVGAVNAVVNAAGFALPAAGKTWMQTGALALVGGPASFVAQQSATKEILQAADYTQQADQYDPLDPVGLALSTVIPLGFGALAMRGAKVRGKTMPDAAPVVHPPDEVVDAARVSLVRQHMDATNPVPGDLAAADAHVKAYTQAMEQMAAGERVQVDVPENVANQASAEMANILEQYRQLAQTEPEPTATNNVVTPDITSYIADQGFQMPDVATDAEPIKGNPFISWLKSAGGVAFDQKIDIVGERGVRGNYAGIFTKKGQQLDTLVQSAVEAGYLSRADVDNANDNGGTRALAELIRRATTGEKIQTVESAQSNKISDAQMRSDMEAADYLERELQALGVDTTAARGNPEILSAYLADHRNALINRKLADIEAEIAQEKISNGEAFNLTPKKIDSQGRIALANELDENAAYDAAANAFDEVDYLNRIEEIIRNAPGRRETSQSRTSAAPVGRVPQSDGQAATSSAIASFNPNALAAEASQLLSDGRSPAEVIGNLQAAGAKVSPELQNMLIGASEFGGRINDLVAQVEALKAQRGPNAQPFDLVAQAVDNLRNGVKVQAPDAPNPLESRLSDLTVRNPTALDAEIAVEFDATGKPTASMTLGEYLDMVKKEAAQDVGDASLLEVAANCFLSGAT